MTHALARTQRVAAGSVLALLLISHLLIIVPPKPIDDAYITYRYADNLAHGMGFVYNAGERVLGTSSPLYTLLLAAGAVARISIPWFSVVLEAASILAIGALVILLFRAAGQIWPGIAAVAVAAVVLRRYLFDAIAMETALYTAGALGALVALRWRRFGVAAALAGPVALLRPEGFLIGIPLILSLAEHRREWWPPRRSLIAAVLFSGAVVALWTLFAALWFGSVIPQSAVAKSLQSARAGWPSFGRAVVTNILFDGKTVLPIALVAVAGPVFALLRDRQSWPLWLWLALHTGFFTLTGAPFYRWYFFPIFIGLVIATGYTMWAAHDVVARLMRSPWPLAAGCLVTLCLVRDFRIGVLTSLDDWSSAAAYERMGPWLRDHTPPDGRVAASEIGVLGFTSGRRVIDLMGLVTPVAVELRTQGRGGDLPMQFLPDYLVYPDVNRARTPRETLGEMFFETYAEVHSESIVSQLPEEQRTIAYRLRQFRPARAVIGADLDGDGAEELIETRADDLSSLWVRWKPDGAWVPLALPDLGRSSASPGALASGDLNGDGCDEIVLGVPGASPAGRLFAGEILILFGSPGLRGSQQTPHTAIIRGEDVADGLGWSLACGDLDGDGRDDVAAGTPRAASVANGRFQAGEVRVIWGGALTPGAVIDLREPGAAGVIQISSVLGASPNDLLGWSLACADFNGDGLQDLAIGARGVAPRGRTAAGEVVLIPGNRERLNTAIDLWSLTQTQAAGAAQFMGDDPGDSLGAALAAADLSGDGLGDLIVGAPGGDGPDNRSPGRGEILVIWGVPEIRASRIDFDSDGEIAPIGETRIFGRDSERLAGSALAAGDCDGDGLADLIVRSESEDGSDAMHLIAGRQIEPSSTLNLSEEASQETLNSDSPWPLSAGAVSTLGSSDAVH